MQRLRSTVSTFRLLHRGSRHRRFQGRSSHLDALCSFSTSVKPQSDIKGEENVKKVVLNEVEKSVVKVDLDDGEEESVKKKSAKSASFATRAATTLKNIAVKTMDVITHPRRTWKHIKAEANHYYVGSKLLWVEVKLATQIINRVLAGHGMTRRERNQLVRTTMDVFRVVPLSIFVIVPFMELLLPFALKLFPNMLPSTFQEAYKKEEAMKAELKMRLAVAGFFQETLQEMARKKKTKKGGQKSDEKGGGGKEIVDFIEKARLGEPMPKEQVIRIAGQFKDELTLANVSRPQLVSMCQYMGLQPYGADAFLRFQLRTKLRVLKEDDRRILWEGIESLSEEELREACQDRGMRSFGMDQVAYVRQLQEWLDLSIQKNIPISLLIMSRAFMLSTKSYARGSFAEPEDVIRSSMSSLDSDTINEVVLDSIKSEEENSIDVKTRKLESLQFQSEMIEEEREETSKVEKQKEMEKEKEKEKEKVMIATDAGVDVMYEATRESMQQASGESSSEQKMEQTEPVPQMKAQATDIADQVKNKSETAQNTAAAEVAGSTGSVIDRIKELMSSEVSKEEMDEHVKDFSIDELEMLADLARGSSVQHEKAQLAILEASVGGLLDQIENDKAKAKEAKEAKENESAVIEEVEETFAHPDDLEIRDVEQVTHTMTGELQKIEGQEAVDDSETTELEEEEEPEEAEDKSMTAMQTALDKMMKNLKGKVDDTEKALLNKMPMLDLDGDGEITNEEIKMAMMTLFKKNESNMDFETFISELDTNKDGKISIAELLKFIESKKAEQEIGIFKERVTKSSASSQEEAEKK